MYNKKPDPSNLNKVNMHSFLLLAFRVSQVLIYKGGGVKLTTGREKIRQTATIEVVCMYDIALFTSHALKDEKDAYFTVKDLFVLQNMPDNESKYDEINVNKVKPT